MWGLVGHIAASPQVPGGLNLTDVPPVRTNLTLALDAADAVPLKGGPTTYATALGMCTRTLRQKHDGRCVSAVASAPARLAA